MLGLFGRMGRESLLNPEHMGGIGQEPNVVSGDPLSLYRATISFPSAAPAMTILLSDCTATDAANSNEPGKTVITVPCGILKVVSSVPLLLYRASATLASLQHPLGHITPANTSF